MLRREANRKKAYTIWGIVVAFLALVWLAAIILEKTWKLHIKNHNDWF